MAYHKSFIGYSSNEPFSGQTDNSNGHCGQVRSSGDTAACIYTETESPSASAANVPSSNHVTCFQSATNPRSNHSILANHFGNPSAADNIDKAHIPISSSRLEFPSHPSFPPLSPFSRIPTMQSPYAHDDRAYQQYPFSYDMGAINVLPDKEPSDEASTSQLNLGSMPQYNGSQYDGATDGYGWGGESDVDMELDSNPEYPPGSADIMEDHYHHRTFPAHYPPNDASHSFECDEWYINDINPERDYPWRSAGKEHWQQTEIPEPPWRPVDWLHSLYPHAFTQTARNNTPSDISSSASPLSPIDGLTYPYPVSQFPPIVASTLSTQAPYPYICHQMTGIYPCTGVYEPADKTTSAPFITAFLNGNGTVNAPPTDPVLHAPRPVRPIPTVSFEDLAASISNI